MCAAAEPCGGQLLSFPDPPLPDRAVKVHGYAESASAGPPRRRAGRIAERRVDEGRCGCR